MRNDDLSRDFQYSDTLGGISGLSPAKRALLELKLRKHSDSGAIPRLQQHESVPLSFAQQRLWFLDRLEPGSPVYNMASAVRLKGRLHVDALEASLNEIVRRHEILRTTFPMLDGRPIQVIAPSLTITLAIVDLHGLAETERKSEVHRRVNTDARRPFDLVQGPLFRATLLRLDEDEHVLLYCMHHIVSDGWSMGVFFRELAALYKAFSAGESSPLPELPIQYADFAVWQREWLQGKVLEKQLSYWKQQLADLPVLQLPTDRRRPPVQTHGAARESMILSKTMSDALRAVSRREGATLFMTLLAAFQILLQRYSGQNDIVVGTPIAGRNRVEIEGLIGFFLNTLVLRTDLSGNPSFRDLVIRVRQVAIGAYGHQDLPFEKLLEELRPERDLSRTPLFQVFFNMMNSEERLELPGLTAEPLLPLEPTSKFDLTLYVREQKQNVQFNLVYNVDLFKRDRMVEMLRQLKYLLSQIVENPDKRIEHFSLTTLNAKRSLPNPIQPLDSDWKGAVHAHFSLQAQRFPQHLAVLDKWGAWTYEDLDARSNRLANYLRDNGVDRQDIVAIYGHRSAALVWAVMGVLKAGAAFVILDPAYPAIRLVDCLQAVKPRGWLAIEAAGTAPDALQEFIATASFRCSLQLPRYSSAVSGDPLSEYSAEDPRVAVGPDDLAYVAFTSGSTGHPKGILGRHGPLSHFLPWQEHAFNLSALDRFSMLSGLSHDPLQREIFTPLSLGATICIPDPEIIGTSKLADWMAKEQVTFAHLSPAMAQLLTKTAAPDCRIPSLRYAFFIGDKLTRQDVARLQRLAPGVTSIAAYGSTETQRAVGYYIVPQDSDQQDRAAYPLGRGIQDVQLLVLTGGQRLAGVGELGEICVRTPHLARGYLGDETLTQSRFPINPFTGVAGDRLYKTGDLGRYLPDGNVEFAGRVDLQVKIRGFRIELGEIEAVLAQHPSVSETVVLPREDLRGDSRLIAYIVTRPERIPLAGELRSFLRSKLPEYMVPSAFVFLDAVQLTPNAKVDRNALRALDTSTPKLENVYVAPGSPVEKLLAEIWAAVLKLAKVGIHDNFFDLGGHSLLGAELITRIGERFQVDLSVRFLFEFPTIGEMARRLAASEKHDFHLQQETESYFYLVKLQAGQREKKVFCFPYSGGFHAEYAHFAKLARLIGPDYSFYGLRARGTDGLSKPHRSVEEMAADYIKEIQIVQPHGPYFLLGECGGAPEAYETAQQLRSRGERVALLGFLDGRGGSHSLDRYLGRRISARVRYYIARLSESTTLNYLMAGSLFHFSELKRLDGGKRLRYFFEKTGKALVVTLNMLRSKMSSHRRRGSTYENQAKPKKSGRVQRIIRSYGLAVRRYRRRPYGAKITVFANEQWYDKDPALGWADLAVGGLEVYKIPGNHDTYLRDHVQLAADKLKACLQKAEIQASG